MAHKDQSSQKLVNVVVEGLQEKKGIDITVLDLRDTGNSVADFFVICSGNSDTQTQALMDSVEYIVWEQLKQNPWRKEGGGRKEWVLLDYVDVVAHIFQKEKRKYYGLEELWGDAKIMRMGES